MFQKNFSNNILGKEEDLNKIIVNNPVSDIVIALDDMDHDHILKLISV